MRVAKSKIATRAFISMLAIASMIFGLFGVFGATPKASAADLSLFNAGNIISDEAFFDGNSMSESAIQNFLNSKVPSCTINNGQPSHAAGAAYGNTTIADVCLKDFTQQTPNMAAQPGLCTGYQGSSQESAAAIISKIGRACNISPKVLLVLLEKEQSLVRDSWPTWSQYNQATGFACYDNGQPCVTEFAGFFYQVWAAARQLQRYGTTPFTWYPVGQVSQILYQANRPECGTKSVFIQNRATAALYYYTPYTPNSAALEAGYGLGDACSAYGNRNFYQLFVDWFGSTQGFSTGEHFAIAASQIGQNASGIPTNREICGLKDGGCFQSFTNGDFYWSQSSGAYFVQSTLKSAWIRKGIENGALGYPTSHSMCGLVQDGCWQIFQGGFIVFSPTTGAYQVSPDIRQGWMAQSSENGFLRYPQSDTMCGLRDSGCWQIFQGGFIYSSQTTGPHSVRPEVRALWITYGSETGILGYPTTDPSNNTTTYTQTFQGGTITVTNGVARLTSSNDPWGNTLIANTWLGNASTPKMCGLRDSGCWQIFQGGFIYSSQTTGPHSVRPEVRALWITYGSETGILGYPTTDPSNNTTTYTQTFQGGTITVTNGVARLTSSNDPWGNTLIANTWLGNASTPKMCGLRDSGCWQIFQGGFIYSSQTTGPHSVRPEVRALWITYGSETGILGYPTTDPSNNTTTYTQTFQGGTITVTNGVARLTSSNDPWGNTLIANTWLGNASTPKMCGLRDSGCWQIFQGGFIYSSQTTGPHSVRPEVRALWITYGSETGILGYPTTDPSNNTTTYTQTFQGGTITVTNGVARLTSSNDPWGNTLIANTWLGNASTPKMCGLRDSGCWQIFQGGFIYSSQTTGPHSVRPEVRALWITYGSETGILGYPTTDPSNNTTTYTQTFQGGTITVTNGVARRN